MDDASPQTGRPLDMSLYERLMDDGIADADQRGGTSSLCVSPAAKGRMTEADIRAVVDRLADVARVLADADPDDKAEIFRQLGLKLTYHPGERLVRVRRDPVPVGKSMVSEDRAAT